MQPVARKRKKPQSTQQKVNVQTLGARLLGQKRRTTPLERALNEQRVLWLARHCKRRFDAYYSALDSWRLRLENYAKSSEDSFDWRRNKGTRGAEAKGEIFDRHNDSLNIAGSFAEYFYAQAVNDLFGGEPWFAAKPEGRKDDKLANDMTKHLDWKLRPAHVRQNFKQAVWLAATLGTCFTKSLWTTETDTWFEERTALHDSQGAPVKTTQGEYIFDDDEISTSPHPEAMPGDPDAPLVKFPEKDPATLIEDEEPIYKPVRMERSRITYNNVRVCNLHYKDIAFDPTAPELSLNKTGFYHRFERGLLDIINDYHLSDADAQMLFSAIHRRRSEAQQGEQHRNEKRPEDVMDELEEGELPNIPVTLVEGYERLDILRNGRPCGVYVIFAPELELVLHCDFLANVTPGGELPVRAHTINRIPWRIVGRGFFEKFDEVQRQVDTLYCRIIYHDRKCAAPIMGVDRSKFELEDEEPDFEFDPDVAINLKPDADIDKAIQFKQLPDMSNRTVAMMQTAIQMVQLRTGITSASQGDVAGVPEANTATGVKQLITRSAVMLKQLIGALGDSISDDMNYIAKVVYANQDEDETFVYGEGDNAELIELKADAVRGVSLNVRLLLSQSQNSEKLEHAQAAIGIVQSYLGVPEQEKEAVRPLFVQALRALDFQDAENIIRHPAVGIGDVIAMLPPDQQQQAVAMIQTGSQALGLPLPPLPQPQQEISPASASGEASPLAKAA